MYASFVRVQGGAIDVTVDFGQQIAGQTPQIEWGARVTMTWEEASLLHRMLGEHIEGIQKRTGAEIRDLVEIVPRMVKANQPQERQ